MLIRMSPIRRRSNYHGPCGDAFPIVNQWHALLQLCYSKRAVCLLILICIVRSRLMTHVNKSPIKLVLVANWANPLELCFSSTYLLVAPGTWVSVQFQPWVLIKLPNKWLRSDGYGLLVLLLTLNYCLNFCRSQCKAPPQRYVGTLKFGSSVPTKCLSPGLV